MSQKFTIKKITIISGTGVKVHEVGENGVSDIKDVSVEYESCIEFIYQIFVEGVLKYTIINCPVEIEYEDTI